MYAFKASRALQLRIIGGFSLSDPTEFVHHIIPLRKLSSKSSFLPLKAIAVLGIIEECHLIVIAHIFSWILFQYIF
jgi:hypothetical protein